MMLFISLANRKPELLAVPKKSRAGLSYDLIRKYFHQNKTIRKKPFSQSAIAYQAVTVAE